MLTGELPKAATPVTKEEIEETLKAFAKVELAKALNTLHHQIKKDIHSEVSLIMGENTNRLSKIVEGIKETQDLSAAAAQSKVRRKAESKKAGGFSHKAEKNRKTIMISKEKFASNDNDDGSHSKKTFSASDRAGSNRSLALVMHEAEGSSPEPNQQLLPAIDNVDTDEKPITLVELIVLSQTFEYAMAVCVILNVMLLGFETETEARLKSHAGTIFTAVLDILFCVIFTIELALRVTVYQTQIFEESFLLKSISFDALLVVLQIMDQVAVSYSFNIHVLSVLRIVRIARVIRLFHLFDELSALISGMFNSVYTLLWTVFLVALMMYMFAIIIMQTLIATGDMHHDKLGEWFGTVGASVRTMFEVLLGGIEWGDILKTLSTDVSPLLGIIMSCYIVITLFFLMNLVCGVFVDRVTKTVREDKDEHLAKRLSEAFTTLDEQGNESAITFTDFKSKIAKSEDIQAYFRSIDVNPDQTNARGLFELLAFDGSGTISPADIVAGCLRLRGPAKALEIALLSTDVSRISTQVAANFSGVERVNKSLKTIIAHVEKLLDRTLHFEEEEGCDRTLSQ